MSQFKVNKSHCLVKCDRKTSIFFRDHLNTSKEIFRDFLKKKLSKISREIWIQPKFFVATTVHWLVRRRRSDIKARWHFGPKIEKVLLKKLISKERSSHLLQTANRKIYLQKESFNQCHISAPLQKNLLLSTSHCVLYYFT